MQYLILVLYLFYLPMTTVLAAPSGEDYRFDRLWPTLQQPWYFERAYSLAVDSQGYVYVSNQTTETVSKFTGDGHFVRQWKFGEETPICIRIGSNDRLYVLYNRWNQVFIRVFDASGEVIKEWGERDQPAEGSFIYSLRSETLAVGKSRKDNGGDDEVYLLNRYILEGVEGPSGIGYPILQRFSWDGRLTGRWHLEDKPVKPDWHISLAIDSHNHIYVLYKNDNRLVKYEIDAHNQPKRLQDWGDFKSPDDINVDRHDNVYVNDTNNHRIRMLSASTGKFETWTDKKMTTESVTQLAEAIRLSPLPISDKSGPTVLSRIRERLPDVVNSNLSGLWTIFETVLDFSAGPQRFFLPRAIAIGRSPTGDKENVYITLAAPDESIRQYNALTKESRDWQSRGQGGEHMFAPWDIARNSQGSLYVSDAFNHRILKFQDTGKFISAIGEMGVGDGQFILPTGVAVDHQDNLYVVDTGNLRIQKFDAQGKFLYKLGGIKLPDNVVGKVDKSIQFILDQSEFVFPVDIAVDSQNNFYVADLGKNDVKKFTSLGRPVEDFNQQPIGQEFQTWGNDYGQLSGPIGVALDQHDNLYVIEARYSRIQQFTSKGDYVNSWGEEQSQVECNIGGIRGPMSMAIDNQGDVYIRNQRQMQILKIKFHETSCDLLTQWGEEGGLPGQFNEMGGVAVTPDGERVFLVDSQNNQVQVFKKGLFTGGKAIIVAGGGHNNNNTSNNLQPEIEQGAKFAYRTLTYQGFTKQTIYYLSADKSEDLDNNGLPDDIDAVHTKENLEKAITEWAADTDNLTLYLIDHGGDQIFQLNDESDPAKSQVMAAELNGWLNTWQERQRKGVITFIYEACESGSFVKTLTGKNRILITSAAAQEKAALTSQGALSFTNYFWNHIFYGLSIEDAFQEAKDSVISSKWMSQQPQLEDTSNLRRGRYIGNGTAIEGIAPVIPTATLDTDQQPSTITAEVNSASGNRIARVWAVVIYQNVQSDASNRPLTALPSCELNLVAGTTNRFAGECDKLDREGSYQVAVYAYDETGNISKPKLITDVTVGAVLKHKAIVIVAGTEETHPHYQELVGNTRQVYDTLRLEGYDKDDIYYLADVSLGNLPTKAVTLDNVRAALTTWLQEGMGTQDLVIYLTGSGDKEGLQLNKEKEEFLTFKQLKVWLDDLQTQLPGPVVVISEGLYSGYLLPALAHPPEGKQRIVISSTKQDPPIYQEGSFSNLFWQEIAKAFNVREAFVHIEGALSSQAPQLDDNGDGVYRTGDNYDGETAKTFKIGLGIGMAELPKTQLSQQAQVRYQEGKLQVLLLPLSKDYSQYVGLQTPDGSLVILKTPLFSDSGTFTESVELFTGIDSMPAWEGTGEVAIEVAVGDQIPRGEYMVYRYVHENKSVLTGKTFKPENLSKTGFYLR